jgi:hypothetical protein
MLHALNAKTLKIVVAIVKVKYIDERPEHECKIAIDSILRNSEIGQTKGIRATPKVFVLIAQTQEPVSSEQRASLPERI